MKKARKLSIITILFITGQTVLFGQTAADAEEYKDQGNVYFLAGDYQKAIECYSEAIRIDGDYYPAYNNRGAAYYNLQLYDYAINDYTRVIELNPDLAVTYNNRGNAYRRTGNYDLALEDLSKAVEINPGYAEAFNNRGIVYFNRGEFRNAVEDYNLAIEIMPKNPEALINRGAAHSALGNYPEAIENYTRALGFSPANKDAVNNRGVAYYQLGEYKRAIEDYTRAISIDRNFARSYNNRGNAYRKVNEFQKAIEDYTEALRLNPQNTEAYINRGNAFYNMGEYEKSIEDYAESMAIAETNSDKNILILRSWHIANNIYASLPYLPDTVKDNDIIMQFTEFSRDSISRGIRRVEELRSEFGTRGSRTHEQRIYLYYAGVDFENFFGNPSQAFEYSEALRSRGFLEQMGIEAALKLQDLSQGEREGVKKLSSQIGALRNVLESLGKERLEGELNRRYTEASAQLTQAEAELSALDAEIGAHVPRYAALRNPKPVDIETAKAWCGDDRVVLEYVLWDDSIGYTSTRGDIAGGADLDQRPAINSYCLVLTKDGVTAVPLAHDFNYVDKINSLRDKIFPVDKDGKALPLNLEEDFEEERNSLYNALIKPALEYIPSGINNILIVPDGRLAYLPFDILRENSEKKELGASYRISLSPSVSVSVLASQRAVRNSEPLLAFGGAQYNGFYDGYFWKNLPSSGLEVERIRNLFTQSPAVKLGKDVSETAIKEMSANGTLADYSIIHFACHGYFDAAHPWRSGILLSEISEQPDNGEDGNLSVEETAILNLNAQMVVLSACETGLGDETKRSDGMVGLIRSFMVAGTKGVGVSLWSISDMATREFMERLYNYVKRGNLSFREAYYQTRNDFRFSRKGVMKRWAHPYYWAAFTLYE